jgi:hypothetical protein
MNRGLWAIGALMLVATLALAACGSNEEDNDYVEQVNEIQEQLVDEVTETVSGAPPANPEAAAVVAGDLEGVFATTADELQALERPQDVADLHDELVAAIREVGARIGEAEKAFASGNSKQAARAALELQTATTDLQPQLTTLIDDINAQLQE